MKNTSRIITLILVAILAFSLAACGKTGDGNIVGSWKADRLEMSGITVSLSDYEKTTGQNMEYTLEFKEDGTLTGDTYGAPVEGTYNVNGSNVDVKINDVTQVFKLSGNELILEIETVKLILIKK